MSSTNVHSEADNMYCAAAQMIPTEKEVEIPPKSAKPGPSSLDVKFGDTMVIPVEKGMLWKDGKLTDIKGNKIIAKFAPEAVKAIQSKKSKQNDGIGR